jgi:glutaminase
VYEVGDTRQPYTIQSISKPLVYGLALKDRGREAVLNTIGVEPTGDAFNSISLAPETSCPLNPMINTGTIAATSLVAGRSDADKLNRILAVLSRNTSNSGIGLSSRASRRGRIGSREMWAPKRVPYISPAMPLDSWYIRGAIPIHTLP